MLQIFTPSPPSIPQRIYKRIKRWLDLLRLHGARIYLNSTQLKFIENGSRMSKRIPNTVSARNGYPGTRVPGSLPVTRVPGQDPGTREFLLPGCCPLNIVV